MQVMHMNWKTGQMEPCVEHCLERGQIVMGIDGPAHKYDGVVLVRSAWARSNGCKSRVQEVAPST